LPNYRGKIFTGVSKQIAQKQKFLCAIASAQGSTQKQPKSQRSNKISKFSYDSCGYSRVLATFGKNEWILNCNTPYKNLDF